MSAPGDFIPPEAGGFVPPEPGDFVPPELNEVSAPAPVRRRRGFRRNHDQLGILWIRGTLHLGVRRQRRTLAQWSSPAPVHTFEELEAALDTALAEVRFGGADTFLVFEGDQFVHQTEMAPAFSARASRAYLKSKVARYAKERGPVLWVAQPTGEAKGERAFVLHMMEQDFYTRVRRVLAHRRLDLTRVFPMAVAVQRELAGFPVSRGAHVLVAAEAADATILVVAQIGGPLLFSRLILASLEDSPGRAAIEINRSLLYARQQFNVGVDRIWLVTRTGAAQEEVAAKCGGGKVVTVLPTQPAEWVASASRVPRTHPVNLISGYIRRKRRAHFIRVGLVAICWLCLAKFGQHLWHSGEDWAAERNRLEAVRLKYPELLARRDGLAARNLRLAEDQRLWQALRRDTPAPVAVRLLAHLAEILPEDVRLLEYTVRRNEEAAGWLLRCEGVVAGDEDAARDAAAALQARLGGEPWRIRFPERPGGVGRTDPGNGESALQHFTVEGLFLED